MSPRSTRRTALRSLALCLDSHPPHRSGLYLLGCLRPHCLHFFQLVGAIYSLALLITIVDSGSFLIPGTLSDRMIHSLYVVLLSEVIHLYSMELYTAKVHSTRKLLFLVHDSFDLIDTFCRHDSFQIHATLRSSGSFFVRDTICNCGSFNSSGTLPAPGSFVDYGTLPISGSFVLHDTIGQPDSLNYHESFNHNGLFNIS